MSDLTPARAARGRPPRKAREPYSRIDNRDDRLHALQHPAHSLPPAAATPLRARLAGLLPDVGPLLDLMTGAECYLPPDRQIIGLDIDESSLARNATLNARALFDLNAPSALPFASATLGGAACVSGVQYLTSPVTVFREVCRVLSPGAPFVVAYTDVFFPAKAIAIWSILHAPQRAALVSSYFRDAGGWTTPGQRSLNELVHLVWAYKR